MANPEQVKMLKKGAAAWNAWRNTQNTKADLSGANFSGINLSGVDFKNADLSRTRFEQTNLAKADLSGANLFRAFLVEANLTEANLRDAWLSGCDLAGATLDRADFRGATLDAADLSWTSLVETNLSDTDLTLTRLRAATMHNTNFSQAYLDGTLFADVNLGKAVGLNTCEHYGPSIIDHITLQQSAEIPLRFLRGVGMQESLIRTLPTIRDSPEYYSCFISYSVRDEKFARKLHSDLTRINIKCWFAPQDMPIGGKILDEISVAISRRDKVLLVLSESAIASDWVGDEVTKAFEEERKRKRTVLFPIRIDDSVFNSVEPWAAKLRHRNIGDFRRWSSPKHYEEAFEKIRRDLGVNGDAT